MKNGTRGWILYASLLVLFWGVWGAFSSEPNSRYGYPNEMIYIIWAFTMLIPAYFAMRGNTFDRRPVAAMYGLIAGLTGAGGQLLLFQALADGPAYLIFPLVSLSPVITVLMATVLLRERITRLAVVGVVAALVAIVLLSIPSGGGDSGAHGPWLPMAILICVAWGVQAFCMRKAALVGVNDATTFGWMTISGLLLVPVAFAIMGGFPSGAPWQAPALTAVTQVLNAVGALFLTLAALYLEVGSTAREGLAASLRNEGAYVSISRRMVLLLDELAAIDAEARPLAGRAGLQLAPLVLPAT